MPIILLLVVFLKLFGVVSWTPVLWCLGLTVVVGIAEVVTEVPETPPPEWR
jgi:hypothetical protein